MYNKKTKAPYVFTTFRKLRNDNRIIAVFIQTYDHETDKITIFDLDHHEDVDRSFILSDTIQAGYHERETFKQQLMQDYEVIADQVSCLIRCVPNLPFDN